MVVLWVLESNERARQFYTALGFRSNGATRVFLGRPDAPLLDLSDAAVKKMIKAPRPRPNPTEKPPAFHQGRSLSRAAQPRTCLKPSIN